MLIFDSHKMNKVFLYWWNSKPNVGDYASYYIVKKLSQKEVVRKDPNLRLKSIIKKGIWSVVSLGEKPIFSEYLLPGQTVIASIGSILDYCTDKTIVWGTGAREFDSKIKANDFRAVRGKLTRRLIGREDLPIGDPALLLPIVYNKNCGLKYSISIIPHFSEYEFFKKAYGKKYHIIDIRTNDIEYFVDEVRASQYILSSSLHGLIIAMHMVNMLYGLRKGTYIHPILNSMIIFLL